MQKTLGAVVLALSVAPAAHADIAVLTNGLTLKVSAVRVEGENVFLTLKDGGEVGTATAALRGVIPDEILEEVEAAAALPLPAGAAPRDLRTIAIETARRHGLDPDLVLAVISVESGFRADAVSPKGAQGLMQLMPGTARDLGVTDSLDPEKNVEGGSRYLQKLVDRYDGDLTKALAAYNAGPGNVDRHNGIPPFRETQAYVKKVMQRYRDKSASPPLPPVAAATPAGPAAR